MYVFPPMHACGYARTHTRADRHIYLICARAPTNSRIHARMHTDTRSCTNTERTELALARTHNANSRAHSSLDGRGAAARAQERDRNQKHLEAEAAALVPRPVLPSGPAGPIPPIGCVPLSTRTHGLGCVRVARHGWNESPGNGTNHSKNKTCLRPAARTQHARVNARAHARMHARTHAPTRGNGFAAV